jgi:DNA-binding response OmpR family regulator
VKARVLIYEIDPLVSKIFNSRFSQYRHWRIEFCEDSSELKQAFIRNSVNVIIMSRDIENFNCLHFARYARKINKEVGLIILSRSIDKAFEKEAYQIGVDYVIRKPFVAKNLFYQTVNLFKRIGLSNYQLRDQVSEYNSFSSEETFIDEGDILINLQSGEVASEGKSLVVLGSKEKKLLQLLYMYEGTLVPHNLIKKKVFFDITTKRSTVASLIKRVREKISKIETFDIQNIHGKGYKLNINK